MNNKKFDRLCKCTTLLKCRLRSNPQPQADGKYTLPKFVKIKSSACDTIGGILISQFLTEICVSSGGPRQKQTGRVGSSAVKGAGFDFKKIEKSGIASLSTGHGENIIESQLCQ